VAGQSSSRRASYGAASPVIGERGALTRQRIVEAALISFEERGFHATSVDDIATAVDMSRAALYQYFENKEDIFVELLYESGGALLRVVRRLGQLGPTGDGYDNLHWWLGEWAWIYDKYSTMYVQWAAVESPKARIRPLILQFTDACVERISQRLDASSPSGLAPRGAAMVLLAVVIRTNYYRHATRARGLSDDEILDTLATVIQMVLFPGTPPSALMLHDPISGQPLIAERAGRITTSVAVPTAPDGDGNGADVAADRMPARSGSSAVADVGVTTVDLRFADASPRVRTTVRRLLDAGSQVFAAQGYHVASIDDVVSEAGLGRGTFYKYFSDKLDLLSTLAAECADQLPAMMEKFRGLVPEAGRSTALRRWLTDFVRLHRRYAGVFRAMQDLSPGGPALEILGLRIEDTVLRSLDEVLAAVDRPYPLCIPAASLVLLALLERLPDQVLGTQDDMEPEALADLMAAVIEFGFFGVLPASCPPSQVG